MISIISVYNNYNTLKEMLLKSLEKQTIDFELILLDNSNNRYSSAAKALNEGIKKAKGEIIVIVHQDVEFKKQQLDKMIKYLEKLGDNVIVGAAGRKDSEGVITNIKHGTDKKFAGKIRVIEPIEVQTLDEVCIASTKNVFNKILFDEQTCDNWHLYGVDLCLMGKSKEIKSYVIPLDLYHKSKGAVNNLYYDSLLKVSKKHKENYTYIYTSCSVINTNVVFSNIFAWLNKFKNNIKKYLVN